jgi:hypothetical protein
MLEFIVVTAILFGLMLISIEIGQQRRKHLEETVLRIEDSRKVVESFVLTLLGLVLAFSLYSTRDQFKARDMILIDEAEAIRSTNFQIDTLSPGVREQEAKLLEKYVDDIKAYGNAVGNNTDTSLAFNDARKTLNQMRKAVSVEKDELSRQEFIGSLSQLASTAARRNSIVYAALTYEVLILLVVIALLSGFLVGRGLSGERKHQRGHRWIFAMVVAVTLYAIYDYETPRSGFITVNREDTLLDDSLQ